MQKIKTSIIAKMLESNLTNAEINFLIEISHYQHENGTAYGVHYGDVAHCVGFSHETFYDVLRSLANKNLIRYEKTGHNDYDVTIVGNWFHFSSGSKNNGYISTGHDLFFDPHFLALKSNEKLIAMYLIGAVGVDGKKTYHKKIDDFYEFFMSKLKIKKITLMRYMRNLKKFFVIRAMNDVINITPGESIAKWNAPKDVDALADHLMKTAIRRDKSEYSNDTYNDTANLVRQYANKCDAQNKNICTIFLDAIRKCIQQVNKSIRRRSDWNRMLQPAHINSMINIAIS